MDEVLEWSQNQQEWWRDAIRRIVTQDEITSEDIEELTELCKAENEVEETELTAEVIDEDEIEASGGQSSISLSAIKEVENINSLNEGQSLDFQSEGLTVIFGRNASGKSGYVRILKKACRVRGEEDLLLSNVFEEENPKVAEQKATIDYLDGDSQRSFTWNNEVDPPPELRRVSIFDSKAAVPYIEEETNIAYQPQSLMVLNSLATLCGQVQEKLRAEREEARNRERNFDEVQIPEGTEVTELLESISQETSENEVRDLADLSDEEKNELSSLREEIKAIEEGDPEQEIKELERDARVFEKLWGEILAIRKLLTEEKVEEIRAKFDELMTAQQAANSASEELFEAQPLSGIGTDVWRKLWEQARRYSEEEAYPEKEFPHIHDDEARCVLCQQALNDEARERFIDFEEFVQGELREEVEELEDELQHLTEPIQNVKPSDWIGDAKFERLEDYAPENYEGAENFLENSEERQTDIAEAIEGNIDWEDIVKPTPVDADLRETISRIKSRAEEIEEATDEEKFEELIERKRELEAREKLTTLLENVLGEIDRQKKEHALDEAISSTNTRPITNKCDSLAEEISPHLQVNFSQELDNLGVRTLETEYEKTRAGRGDVFHRVNLATDTSSEIPISQVASEGEKRGIALANFLTEISTANHNSGIIFDDPVSSLDHRWRKEVADRLAEEAENRQVIVFTHDLVFFLRLKKAVEDTDDVLIRTVKRRPDGRTGIVRDGLPIEKASAKNRLSRIKDSAQNELKDVYKEAEDEYEYEKEAVRYIARLRGACERAVEKSLLDGVVERFGFDVHTKKIDRIIIEEEDIEFVREFMKKCSELIESHDEPTGVDRPMPDPEDIKEMAIKLDNRRSSWEKRKQNQ